MSSSKKQSFQLNSPQAYDLWSKNYDHFNNPMLAMVQYSFELNPLRLKGRSVIELGSGTGRNIKTVLEAGASSYVGLDQSQGMIEQAKAKYPELKFLNVDIQEKLPFIDESFDFVLVTLVFEHLQNLRPTLSEAFRILKREGTLRILEIHSDLSSSGTKAHFQYEDSEITLPSFPHESNEWLSELKLVGFEKLEVVEQKADTETIRYCPKLAKHEGKRVLIDILATKNS